MPMNATWNEALETTRVWIVDDEGILIGTSGASVWSMINRLRDVLIVVNQWEGQNKEVVPFFSEYLKLSEKKIIQVDSMEIIASTLTAMADADQSEPWTVMQRLPMIDEFNCPNLRYLARDDMFCNSQLYPKHQQDPSPFRHEVETFLVDVSNRSLFQVCLKDGVVCQDVKELLVEYRKTTVSGQQHGSFGLQETNLMPLTVPNKTTRVANAAEIRLYDFPFGPVVLLSSDVPRDEEPSTPPDNNGSVLNELSASIDQANIEASAKRPASTVTSKSHGVASDTAFIKVVGLGDQYTILRGIVISSFLYSSRSSPPGEPEHDVADLVARFLIDKSKLKGPWSAIFQCETDRMVLTSLDRQFDIDHSVLAYRISNGLLADTVTITWQYMQDKIDLWTCYLSFFEKGLLLRQSPGKDGVSIISTSRTLPSTVTAFAKNILDANQLYSKADTILRTPVTVVKDLDKTGSVTGERCLIWVGSARPEYKRETQRYNLANRCVPLVRPGKDVVVLPGNHEGTREYWHFCKEMCGFSESQVVFTSGKEFNLDDDMDEEVILKLKGIIASRPDDNFAIVPYCVTSNFQRWALQFQELGVTVVGEDFAWIEKFGHKGILHRHIRTPDEPSIIEQYAPSIPVPRGYNCSSVPDLLEAFHKLGLPKVVIKPHHGAAGEGIVFVTEEETLKLYDFGYGEVAMEEFVNIDKVNDLDLSPAVHYFGGNLVGTDLVDQIMLGTTYYGWKKSVAPRLFQALVFDSVKKMIKAFCPQGPGGFDFLSSDGQPLLTDVNTGRFNGAHYPKLFRDMYAPNSSFYCWKACPPLSMYLNTWWKRVVKMGLAFHPGKSKRGIFPLYYLRGLSGQFIAIDDTAEKSEELYKTVSHLLVTGPVHIPRMELPLVNKSQSEITPNSGLIWLFNAPRDIQSFLLPLSILKRGKDIVVVPKNRGMQEYCEFSLDVLGLDPWQIVFLDGLVLTEENVADLKKVVESRPEVYALVTTSVSPSKGHALAALLGEEISFYGDALDFSLKFMSTCAVLRDFANADKPSNVESVTIEHISSGYVCNSQTDLLGAFRALSTSSLPFVGRKAQMLVKQIFQDRDTRAFVSTESEVRMLPLQAPMSIKAVLAEDTTADKYRYRLVVPFLGRKPLTDTVDQIIVSENATAWRTSTVDTRLSNKAKQMVWDYLDKHKPNGIGVFLFVVRGGVPYMDDILYGLHETHIFSLFMEQHASSAPCFFAWRFTPSEDLDIWSCWMRFMESDLLLPINASARLGANSEGIFPLSYIRGTSSMFISVGTSHESVAEIYAKADTILRTPVTVVKDLDKTGSVTGERCLIWVGSARPEYKRETQRYNLANRFVPLVRPGKDVVVLPGNHEGTREYWHFCKEMCGFSESQVVFTSGKEFNLDDDMDEEVILKLKGIIASRPDDNFAIVPYCVTSNFQRWALQFQELGVTVVGEDFAWIEKFGHKGILHRHIRTPDEPSIIEQYAPSIPVPRGYNCSSVPDLLEAFHKLGLPKVVIKPHHGAAGEGIVFVTEEETLKLYDFGYGEVAMEEYLTLDKTSDGFDRVFSVTYQHGVVDPDCVLEKVVLDFEVKMLRKSLGKKSILSRMTRMVNGLVNGIGTQGFGSVTIAMVEGNPVVIDINTGKIDISNVAKMFRNIYASDSAFTFWMTNVPRSLSLDKWWTRAMEANSAFTKGGAGVFPLNYQKGSISELITIGATTFDCVGIEGKSRPTFRLHYRGKGATLSTSNPNPATVILLTNLEVVYSPAVSNNSSILICGGIIVGFPSEKQVSHVKDAFPLLEVIDCSSCIAVPGYVDVHVHLTGGGGEFGPRSRTPEAKFQELIAAGLTTVVGVLGTDNVSRSQECLLTKCKALNDEGITAKMWCASYSLPPSTITGSIKRDICLIDEVIGAGEIAISDSRGSQPDFASLAAYAADCHVGGLLSGKAGKMYCHIGEDAALLDPLFEVVEKTSIPITTILPTHCQRSAELVAAAEKWIAEGGYVDLTFRGTKAHEVVLSYYDKGVDLSRVICSSDAYGSLPSFDTEGKLVQYAVADAGALHRSILAFYFDHQWPLERILPLVTSNPASFLKLHGKGTILAGNDADILILDSETLSIKRVFAKGVDVTNRKSFV